MQNLIHTASIHGKKFCGWLKMSTPLIGLNWSPFLGRLKRTKKFSFLTFIAACRRKFQRKTCKQYASLSCPDYPKRRDCTSVWIRSSHILQSRPRVDRKYLRMRAFSDMCSQLLKPSILPYGKTRNRRARVELFDCNGMIMLILLLASSNASFDFSVEFNHDIHPGWEHLDLPLKIRKWIQQNPRPTSIIQREKLMRAVAWGELSNNEWIQDRWNIHDVRKAVVPQHYQYADAEGESIDSRISHSCWMELFEKGYVGTYCLSFPVPPDVGEGLRLSFNLMSIVAGIERTVSLGDDDGVIFTGFCTALVPIKVISNRALERSIQWHIIIQRPPNNRFRSIHDRHDFWNLIPSERLHDISGLRGIAYLGWTMEAEFRFGTEVREHCYESSSLKSSPFSWNSSQRTISVAAQIGLPFGGSALSIQLQRTQQRTSTICPYAYPHATFRETRRFLPL